ncbi:hypothetical protein FA13DRAFT_1160715 [Coprinellus micaceus]|uniref:Uncharacterized protein n=1 Tax=Coprinellus micaceus TaxID=71717 RepID=A0A4Y7SUZ1_COPMI|nr:hypothetical protein FA13DRAFT_1160715 [Coprinellus micaceus]
MSRMSKATCTKPNSKFSAAQANFRPSNMVPPSHHSNVRTKATRTLIRLDTLRPLQKFQSNRTDHLRPLSRIPVRGRCPRPHEPLQRPPKRFGRRLDRHHHHYTFASEPPTVRKRKRLNGVADAYDFGRPEEDAEWSTLAATKKLRKDLNG